MNDSKITVVGAGLAGCEAAWQIAGFGIHVDLIDMKPHKMTPAHHNVGFAELVCSNSLKSDRLDNACGLLKEELRKLGSVCIAAADENRVPAGSALAVDRSSFSSSITEKIQSHPLIEVHSREVDSIPDSGTVIIATGPLTTPALLQSITGVTGEDRLYFYDAAAPMIHTESIDMDKVFRQSRYQKGGDDYLNCPMDKETFEKFANELLNAETAQIHDFEKKKVFESCMPVEILASRGIDTLRFGPMRPVGLIDPRTGERPYACVQLRQDDFSAGIYSPVGFQTRLKFSEQKRVFSMIPGLERAEFARYGVMHQNSFIRSPEILDRTYMVKDRPGLFFAGQITGVEGYVESVSSGAIAGIYAALYVLDKQVSPENLNETMTGALSGYISEASSKNFQPMNANFGIIESMDLPKKIGKKEKYLAISGRALGKMDAFNKIISSYRI